jgi:hypothetical protein
MERVKWNAQSVIIYAKKKIALFQIGNAPTVEWLMPKLKLL